MNIDNKILLIIKKLNLNNDIINYIYDIYLIDKYFSKNLNNKSLKLFKNKYSNDKNKLDIIVKNLKPEYLNIYYIKQLLINDEIIKKILLKMPILIKSLDYKYKNDSELITMICSKDKTMIKYASNTLKSNYDFMIKMIEIYPASIYYANEELKDNFELVIKAINLDGDVFEYISERLKNDINIINIAKKKNYNYFY